MWGALTKHTRTPTQNSPIQIADFIIKKHSFVFLEKVYIFHLILVTCFRTYHWRLSGGRSQYSVNYIEILKTGCYLWEAYDGSRANKEISSIVLCGRTGFEENHPRWLGTPKGNCADFKSLTGTGAFMWGLQVKWHDAFMFSTFSSSNTKL